MIPRGTVRARSDQSLSITAAVSATATFLVSTDDSSLLVTAVPAPALALTFKTGAALPPFRLSQQQPQASAPPPWPVTGVREKETTDASEPEPESRSAASAPAITVGEAPPPEVPTAVEKAAPPESSAPASHQIELIIDSLPHFTLTDPIPVVIVSLGDKLFTASVRNIAIQTTGTSIGEALLVLKEQIEEIYTDLKKRLSHLDTDQKATLQLLQTYIAADTRRREWL